MEGKCFNYLFKLFPLVQNHKFPCEISSTFFVSLKGVIAVDNYPYNAAMVRSPLSTSIFSWTILRHNSRTYGLGYQNLKRNTKSANRHHLSNMTKLELVYLPMGRAGDEGYDFRDVENWFQTSLALGKTFSF